MERARSENDIPTLPAFPVPGVGEAVPFFPAPPPPAPRPRSALVIDTAAEGFFAVGLARNDVAPQPHDEVAPADDEPSAPGIAAAQRRRDLSRYVLAVVVVCLGILGASAAQIG
jgi:hypothetical protein